MKGITSVIVLALSTVLSQTGADADVERKETMTETLRFERTEGKRLVIVDNVFGSIDVKGYDGDEVRVTIHKTTVARSEAALREADEEVQLDISEEDDLIELYVDGPFRDRRRRDFDWRGYRREGYKVKFDFELEVPRSSSIELSTVDEGEIRVVSVEDDFEVQNVNGGVEMKGVRGSGEASAVNGKVTVEFDANPTGDCHFGTVNGEIRLHFQPDFSAEIYMETMNGDAFTDFEVEALPHRVRTDNSRNGTNVYRVGRLTGVRVGRGGPEITLNTINGDMFILSR